MLQAAKDSGSDSEAEVWSFDRDINEVFRLLPPELCPKTSQEKTSIKQLSGKEHLMEWHATPLLVLPQSKLVENTTKFIQNKLDMDKCCKDWICPQNLVMSLAPTKFYKSQNQYFLIGEADDSLLDLSNKGRSYIPIKNFEAFEKKARKLIAINSHADLFSSAAYLCLQQESMPVAALSRLLEAAGKSIKHATAMSTILATEIFQAKCDSALANSKLLLENSSDELRNALINSKTLFDGKIKEVAKANYEAKQQRFLVSTSSSTAIQHQKPLATSRAFNIPEVPTKPSRTKQTQPYRTKTHTQSFTSSNRKDFTKRRVTPNSSPPLKLPLPPQSPENQPFPLPVLPSLDIPVGRRLAHFVEHWEKLTDNKCVLSIMRNGFRIPFRLIPPLLSVLIKLSQSSSPFLREEIDILLQKWAVERVQDPGTPGF